MSTEKIEKKFLKVKEVAEMLAVSESLIYSKVEKSLIPCKRLGGRILIPYDFIMKFINP